MNSIFIIYKIYWPGKAFYFGKTKGFRKRRNRHLREMKDGTHHNKNLIRKYKLYGSPKIKIIGYASSDEELTTKERQLLEKYINNRRCCNLCAH